ncbi:hypothetical protein CCACVL1_18016 [Corchorus capsularis]|uniref:Uncharacterized protein n=1 Tax=Corchorus capsularis TaxID=210143 RepID=A0A1R3HNQ1_COCAP|nr:hypothetical protein CCACVL1_18016 [Corchorus capsularis]
MKQSPTLVIGNLMKIRTASFELSILKEYPPPKNEEAGIIQKEREWHLAV